MDSYYPIMLKLSTQRIVVVGGGDIAARKIGNLLNSGAQQITVIALSICPELEQRLAEKQIRWLKQSYEISILKSATLVFAASDDKSLNEQISKDALACGILVCNVSDGVQGNFITPAIAKHDGLTIAISSAGASPSLLKHIKKELGEQYLPRYAQAKQWLEQLRKDVLRSPLTQNQRQAMMELAVREAIEGKIKSYEQWYNSLYNVIVQIEGED